MFKILYICTHNRCRSVLSEAITNHLSDGSIVAQSAGSQPAGEVHPLTLKYLNEKGIETQGLKSQSWDELDEFEPDLAITVCDSAANETCPIWLGQSAKIHWGLPDPSKLGEDNDATKQAFYDVMQTIEQRVQAMLNIDYSNLSQQEAITQIQLLSQQNK